MLQTVVIHTLMDSATKQATEAVLDSLGMTPAEAIRLFYRQIATRKEFPFELHVPNALTASVLEKSDRNEEIERFNTADELYASWDQ